MFVEQRGRSRPCSAAAGPRAGGCGVPDASAAPAAARPPSAWARRYARALGRWRRRSRRGRRRRRRAARPGPTARSTRAVAVLGGLALVVAWPLLLAAVGAYSARVLRHRQRGVPRASAGRAVLLLAAAGFVSYAAAARPSRARSSSSRVPALDRGHAGRAASSARAWLRRLRAARPLHQARRRRRPRRRRRWTWSTGCRREPLRRHARSSPPASPPPTAAAGRGSHRRARRRPGRRGGDGRRAWAPTPSRSPRPARPRRSTCASCPGSWRAAASSCSSRPGLIEVAGPAAAHPPVRGAAAAVGRAAAVRGLAARGQGRPGPRGRAASPCVLLAPVLLAIALAVRLAGPGPVLFRQERVGVNGRPFTMLKFRSMVVDADQQARRAPRRTTTPTACCSRCARTRGSPRSAAWLRRLSLDELPQLFNVLGGSMSLVGPAPAAARRGRPLRRLGQPPAAGEAGPDRPVADLRAAATCPGRRPCAWTCATSRTGRWRWTC